MKTLHIAQSYRTQMYEVSSAQSPFVKKWISTGRSFLHNPISNNLYEVNFQQSSTPVFVQLLSYIFLKCGRFVQQFYYKSHHSVHKFFREMGQVLHHAELSPRFSFGLHTYNTLRNIYYL